MVKEIKYIAEIGLNHNGSISLAKKHIEKAKEIGADIAKFQTYFTQTRAKKNSPIRDILNQCELSPEDFYDLKCFCENIGIEFASTPFCEKSAEVLDDLNCSTIKIASFQLANHKLISKVLNFKSCEKLIVSTGVSSSTQLLFINNLYDSFSQTKPSISFLHCISEYPISSPQNMNLSNITFMSNLTGKEIGFSDHSIGVKAPSYAVLLGASIIEKHFTLDTELEGADHAMSADPETFKRMIEYCNEAKLMLGERRLNKYYDCEIGSVPYCDHS